MSVHPDLRAVADTLITNSEDRGEVTLDEIGEAIGARSFSTDDIDHLLTMLERGKRRIMAPRGGGGTADLKRVITAARAVQLRTRKRASVDEICAETGLGAATVRAALLLARVMGR